VFREVTVKGFDPSDYQTTQVRCLPTTDSKTNKNFMFDSVLFSPAF
jgi:hypothetical protein